MKLRSLALSLLAVMHFVPGVLGAPGAPAAESHEQMSLEEFLGRPSMRGLVAQLEAMSGGRMFERRGDLVLISLGGWASPIGDLTGDDIDEVATSSIKTDGTGSSYSTSLDVLNGRNGRSLFGEPIEVRGFAFARKARVGPDADEGLLVNSFDFTSSGPLWINNVQISALTAQGERLWTRDFLGYEQWDGWHVEVNMVHGTSALDMTRGKQTDVAVYISDGTRGGPQNAARARIAVIDGADGSQVAERSYALERITWGTLCPLPDVDRDGKDELLVSMPRTKDSPGWIEALTSLSADPMWRAEGRFIGFSYVEKVADIAGDGGPEAVLQSWGPEGVFALDALTGKKVLLSKGSFAGAPGDIDGDGKVDVVITKQSSKRRDPRLVQQLWAQDASGRKLWNETLRSEVEHSPNLSASSGAWSAGDVHGDGLRDLEAVHFVSAHDDHNFWYPLERHHVIDAASGKVLDRGALQLLGGSLDGRGADTVRIEPDRNQLTLDVRDGLTGRSLWNKALRSPGRDPYGWAIILDGPGPAEDLLVGIQGNNGDVVYLLDGRTGDLRWKRNLS